MELTNFQKKLVPQIIDKKILSLSDLICLYCEYDKEVLQINDENESIPLYIVKDIEKYKTTFIEYQTLVKKLEKNNLLVIIRHFKTKIAYCYYNSKRQKTNLPEIFPFLDGFIEIELYPLPELKLFKKNNYKTEEKLQVKRANCRSYISMIISILIAIASICITIYFNYYKDVNVNVVNKDLFIKYKNLDEEDGKILEEIIKEKKILIENKSKSK